MKPDPVKPMETMLEIERMRVTICRDLALTSQRWQALEKLAMRLNVGRAGRAMQVKRLGAMLDAIATGKIGLVRMDDPQGRIFTTENEPAGKPGGSKDHWWNRD